jgi:hypothetical protein
MSSSIEAFLERAASTISPRRTMAFIIASGEFASSALCFSSALDSSERNKRRGRNLERKTPETSSPGKDCSAEGISQSPGAADVRELWGEIGIKLAMNKNFDERVCNEDGGRGEVETEQ